VAIGVALIAAGSLVAVLAVVGAWRRISTAAGVILVAACGVVVGTGALLVQEEASAGEWVITIIVLGALTPVHALLLFGRPGGRGGDHVVAQGPGGA
jgi:hypothetical protein